MYVNGNQSEVGGLVIDGTDVAAGANYFYIPMASAGFRFVSIQLVLTAMTVTIEATNDQETNSSGAITDANKTWTDITNDMFGVVSKTTSGALIVDTPLPFSKIRIVYTRSNATNSITARITRTN